MNLLIDIGNTFVKTAVFNDKNQMVSHERVPIGETNIHIEKLTATYQPKNALISATGKIMSGLENLLKKNKIQFLYLNHTLNFPFIIDYKNPKNLGSDRIALAAGTVIKATGKNRLVIDAGTCITYDFIDQSNIFRGGIISPGIDMRLKSMHEYTANLPLIENLSITEEIPLTGQDTISCMKSGALWGAVNEIEGIIVKYKLKYKDLTVFLTGGDQIILERYLKNKIFVNSKFLLFEGMNVILNMNK